MHAFKNMQFLCQKSNFADLAKILFFQMVQHRLLLFFMLRDMAPKLHSNKKVQDTTKNLKKVSLKISFIKRFVTTNERL